MEQGRYFPANVPWWAGDVSGGIEPFSSSSPTPGGPTCQSAPTLSQGMFGLLSPVVDSDVSGAYRHSSLRRGTGPPAPRTNR